MCIRAGTGAGSRVTNHHSPMKQAIADLHPAYMALVMATGIVSIAASGQGMEWIGIGLFWLNVVLYAVLVGLYLLRAVWHWDRFAADVVHHGRGVGFFTVVAANNVLGSQCVLIANSPGIGAAFWFVGIGLWLVVTYTIFTAFTVKEVKPTLAEGINGGWLVAVVAAQSVAILGGLLVGQFPEQSDVITFFILAMWLGGGMLYIWLISLIFFRYTFFPMDPADLQPPYWINMGAVAISTLAGSIIVQSAEKSPLLDQFLPFLKGFTLFFWATATWWIPMLVILGFWRHVYRRFPLKYSPMYWGAVFPLGMYTVCTRQLSAAIEYPPLLVIPRGFVYIALAAWAATFMGLLLELIHTLRPSNSTRE